MNKENWRNPCPASPLWYERYKLDIQNRYWHYLLNNHMDTYYIWGTIYLDVPINQMLEEMKDLDVWGMIRDR